MSAGHATTTGSKGRKRGGPARISRHLIVAAARDMDPQTLTMQAVADRLGVDRKALNYHVTDRDGLLRLLAANAFERTSAEAFKEYFEASGIAPDDDWRVAIRTWATTVRDSMVASGIVSAFFPLGADTLSVLKPAEIVLQQMLRAGFDIRTAGRGLTFVTSFAMGVGRDILLENQLGEHPQASEVRALLALGGDTSDYAAFLELTTTGINGPDDVAHQFEFEVEVFIAGMEQRLRSTRAAASGEHEPPLESVGSSAEPTGEPLDMVIR